MDKIMVRELTAYCWDCPNCGTFNMHDIYNEPICEHCGDEFEIEEVEN